MKPLDHLTVEPDRKAGASGSLRANYRERLYQNYIEHHFGQARDLSPAGLEQQTAAYRRAFARFLPPNKQTEILELGCGSGAFLRMLQQMGYTNARGIDISPEQVKLARRLGVANVECADIRQALMAFADKFHLIVAIDVVEHFHKEEILPLLEAVRRALKPGGMLLMQSPNADGPFAGRYRYGDFTHEIAFTDSSIRQILSGTGFNEIQVYPADPIPHGFFSAGRWVLWKAIRFLLTLYLAAETGGLRGHILTQNLIATATKSMPADPVKNVSQFNPRRSD